MEYISADIGDGKALSVKVDANSENITGRNRTRLIRAFKARGIAPPPGSNKKEIKDYYDKWITKVKKGKGSDEEMTDRDKRIKKEDSMIAYNHTLKKMKNSNKQDAYALMEKHNRDYPDQKITKLKYDGWGFNEDVSAKELVKIKENYAKNRSNLSNPLNVSYK